MKLRDSLKAWGPVAFWMALMFIGSTDLMSAEHTSRFLTPFLRWFYPEISPGAVAHIHLLARKAAHLTEYAVLTGLLFRALRGLVGGFWWRGVAAFVPALLFAVADECHQSLVPSRTASLGDVLLDCTGAIGGIIICRVIYLQLTRRARHISPG